MGELNVVVVMSLAISLSGVALANHAAVDAQNGRPAGPPAVSATNQQVSEIATQVGRDLGGYSAFNNCTTYALRFHQIAQGRNIAVRTVGGHCPGGPAGHQWNMVRLQDGDWYFVEPQHGGITRPGFANPDSPSPAATCAALEGKLDRDGNCPCRVTLNSTTPVPSNTSPVLSCALNSEFRDKGKSVDTFRECQECCQRRNSYHVKNSSDLYEKWSQQCVSTCRSHFFPEKQDSDDISSPGRNDSMAVATGRACVAGTSNWSWSSKAEQCRGCCLDGARKGYYPRRNLGSCQAVCNAEYK